MQINSTSDLPQKRVVGSSINGGFRHRNWLVHRFVAVTRVIRTDFLHRRVEGRDIFERRHDGRA